MLVDNHRMTSSDDTQVCWAVEPTDKNGGPAYDKAWKVLGPGEPEPDQDAQVAEVMRRAEADAARAAQHRAG